MKGERKAWRAGAWSVGMGLTLLVMVWRTEAPPRPAQWFLTWSNAATWMVNVVEYKTNLTEPWEVYAVVTNGYTNQGWARLERTNGQCFFRVGNVGIQ